MGVVLTFREPAAKASPLILRFLPLLDSGISLWRLATQRAHDMVCAMSSLRFFPSFALFALCLSAAINAFSANPPAADREPARAPLEFSRLDLTDGRRLQDVVVRSYDAASGKLLVIANGTAMSIPLNLVPLPLHPTLKNAPASGATVSMHPRRPAASSSSETDSAATNNRSSDRSPHLHLPSSPAPDVNPSSAPSDDTAVSPVPYPPARQATPNQIVAAQAGDDLAAHKAAALRRAQQFYRFEFRLGTDAGVVSDLDLDLTTPQSVTGWVGRYRTQGKAYIEIYDSRGRSFQRRTSAFEVITEQKPEDDDIRVVEFTPRS